MRKRVELTNEAFCYYWMLPECPDKDGKHKVIIIQEGTDGYYESDLNETKQTIMNMNERMGLTKDEVYELGQLNCKTMFAFQPKGIAYNKASHKKYKQKNE